MTRDPSGTNETGLHEITSPSETTDARAPGYVQVAQAAAATPPAGTPPVPAPELLIKPGVGNVVTLPAGTSLTQVAIEGDNIVLVQPDGTRVVIEGGALDIPTFIIGGAEIPQDALILAFKASDIDVAAGPEGLSVVTTQSPDSGGNNFAEPVPGIGDAGPPIDLLDPTALQFGALDQNELFNSLNLDPTITVNPDGEGNLIIGSETVREDAMSTGTDDGSNKEFGFGTFQISDSNGLATIVSVTINGVTIPIGSLAGQTIPGTYGTLHIVSYNANTGQGVYTYELTSQYSHPHAQEYDGVPPDEVVNAADNFVFTVSDGIGNSAPATLQINIVDDEPQLLDIRLDGEEMSAARLEVDETEDKGDRYAAGEAEDGSNPNIDDAGPGLGQVTSNIQGGLQSVFSTTYVAGADGLASETVQIAFGGFPQNGAGVATNLSAVNGGAISLFLENGVIVGRDTALDEVFRIEIIDVNPDPAVTELQFQLTLSEAIEHPDNSTLDEAVELLVNGQSPVTLVATVTIVDGDGDYDTLTESFNLIDGEGSYFHFDDDGPKIVADAQPVQLMLGENDITSLLSWGSSPDLLFGDGADLDQSHSELLLQSAVVNGSLSALVDFGSDGAAANGAFGLASDAAAKIEALGLESKGAAITCVSGVLAGNQVLAGFADGRLVFALTVKPDGTFEFRQFDQLDHQYGDNGANTDLVSANGTIPSIDFGAIITATDGDGDSVPLNGLVQITILDDVPQLSLKATKEKVVHDETSGNQSNNGADDTSAAGVVALFAGVANAGPALGYAKDSSNVVSWNLNGGADDNVSVDVELNVTNSDSGLQTTAGEPITLFEEGNYIVGRTPNGEAAFAIHIDQDGEISIVQYQAIHHADTASKNETQFLTSGKIEVVVTATDNDGDSVTKSVDIGKQIRFNDDGPTAKNDDAQSVVEGNAIGGNVITPEAADDVNGSGADTLGTDGATVTRVSFDNGATWEAIAPNGVTTIVKAFGTYTFTADGAWTFTAVSGIVNPSPVNADFRYELTDGDGDTSQANQPITITDGRGPSGPESVSLVVDDENLPDGTNPAGPDSDSETITFTVGSDPIANISFDGNLGNLLGLNWTPVGTNQIIGKDADGTEIIRLDLSYVPNSNVATVTATLLDNYDSHPDITADDLQNLGSVKVIATDIDGDPAATIVNVGVSDDVPTISVAQIGLGENLIVNGSFEQGHGLGPGGWNNFHTLPGWTSNDNGTPDDTSDDIPFEVQVGGAGGVAAQDGSALVELDADLEGNGGPDLNPTNNTNTIIQQTVATEAGADYVLTFWYAPRPGDGDPDSSSMNVLINGQSVKSIVSDTTDEGWTKITISFTATGAATTIGFEGAGQANEFGAFIDNVSLHRANVIVDEDGLVSPPDHSQGNHDEQPGDAAGNETVGSGSLGINWGADNDDVADAGGVQDGVGSGLIGRSVTFTNTDVEVTGQNGEQLTSKGDVVTFELSEDGTVLRGIAGADDRVVFEVRLSDDGSGQFTFELNDQLDHALGMDENDISLKFNFTATDSDGDSVDGSFYVGVDDDVPVVTGELECEVVTESTPPQVEGKTANFVFVLDTSQSVESQLLLMKNAVNDLLDKISETDAEAVRVHIVEFGSEADVVGTYDIIVGGEVDEAALQKAMDDVAGLDDNGNTNYEAGFQQALLHIQGGDKTHAIDDSEKFNGNSTGGDDDAHVLYSGNTKIAVVSGWDEDGDELVGANGNSDGWGVDRDDPNENGNDPLDNDEERLRFDFGAFNDFDDAGTYAADDEAVGFNGPAITSAKFDLTDVDDDGPVTFSWTIHFVGGGPTQSGSESVSGGDTESKVIAGTGANAGKEIAYIEFSSNGGEGRVDLKSVTEHVPPGTLPDADINEVIFLSDGEPNRALDNNGNEISAGAQEAINQITGSDGSDEVDETENDDDGAGQDQDFNITVIGLNLQPQTLSIDGSEEFNGNSTGGDDDAHVLYSGNTKIAVVSGWDDDGDELVGANGNNSDGWGVDRESEGSSSSLNDGDERLRFDFGAFNDHDGAGTYEADGDAVGFNGPAVTSATFDLNDNDGNGATQFGWTVHFVGGGSETGSESVGSGNSEEVTITGSGLNAGKEIAYIEFTGTGGGGRVELQTVVTKTLAGQSILDQIDSSGASANITEASGLANELSDILDQLDEGESNGGSGGVSEVSVELADLFGAGADDDLTFSMTDETGDLPDLTSGNTALVYTVTHENGQDVLTATKGQGGEPVFTLTLESDGTATFKLLGNVDHAAGEQFKHIDFDSIIRATDHDGDSAEVPLCIKVENATDLTPTVTVAYANNGVVNEAALGWGNWGTNEGSLPGDNIDPTEATSGTITFNAGDGPAQVLVNGNDVTQGGTITTQYGTLVITKGGEGVLNWTYTLDDNTLDHDTPNQTGDDDTVFDDFEVKVVDTENTAATDDDDTVAETIRITITDDGPKAQLVYDSEPGAAVTQDADTIDDAFDTASANFKYGFLVDGTYGADGGGDVAWAFTLGTVTQGAETGMFHDGAAIHVYEVGGVIYGSTETDIANAATNPVFTITVNANGDVTLTQYQEIQHDNPPSASSNYDQQVEYLASGLVQLNVKVIVSDADGDTATDQETVDLGGKIGFADHGPTVTVTGSIEALTVDETAFGTDATGNFGGAFTSNYGADGAHSTPSTANSYALSIGAGSSGLVDTQTNTAVTLSMENGVVLGKNGNGVEVFRITVSETGYVTLDQSRAVKHANPADSNEPKSLAALDLVKLTVTATDADGDTDSETVNIGDKFVFRDDAPDANSDTALTVDETAGATDGTNLLANDDKGADGATVTHVSFDNGATWLDVDPAGSSFTPAGGAGTYTVDGQGNWTFNPIENADSNDKTGDFLYRITDGDGDTSTALQEVDVNNVNQSLLIVGSNESDDNPADPDHEVPNPNGPDSGIITGGGADDILVGDPGAQPIITAGDKANIVLVLDTSASMGSGAGGNNMIEPMEDAVKALLADLRGSGAQDVRVHIVTFDLNGASIGTYNLISNGVEMSLENLGAAQATVEGLSGGLEAGTNYEAGLYQAYRWISGQLNVGDDPLANADINKVLFISDGEPNAYLQGNHGSPSSPQSANFDQTALDQILGNSNPPGPNNTDDTNEVTMIENLGYTIEAIGIQLAGTALERLSTVEGVGGQATSITNADQLTEAVGEIAGGTNIPAAAGADQIQGGGGNDIIFGDVMETDALAAEQGLSTPANSGWDVFEKLEAGQGNDPNWDRQDTVDYIKAHHAELAAELPRTGGNDVIDGGAGDDIIYAQEGADQIIQTLVSGGNDIVHGGSEPAGGVDLFQLDMTGASETIYLETAAAYEARTGNAYVAPTGFNEAETILISNADSDGGAGSGAGHKVFTQMTEIEEVAVFGGASSETVVVSGNFTGTALLPTTIHYDGQAGNDTLDLSQRASNHRVVAFGGADNDTVKLDFKMSEVTSVVSINSGLGVAITHNGMTDEFTTFENFTFEGNVTLTMNDVVNLDVVAPTVESVSYVVDDGTVKAGESVVFKVTFSEVVSVTGMPMLLLNSGATAKAIYISGSGGNELAFIYHVQPGDNASDLEVIGIDLNGATIRDAVGHDAVMTGVVTNPAGALAVDTDAPDLTGSSPADDATAVVVGSNIVLTFEEAVTAGTGSITISNGTDIRTIAINDPQVTINGDTVTIDLTTDLQPNTTYNVQMPSGVLNDAAGNPFGGISNDTTLDFTTKPANEAPDGGADKIITNIVDGSPIIIPHSALLANDSDPDGDELSIEGAGSATGGTVSVGPGGITFTPTGLAPEHTYIDEDFGTQENDDGGFEYHDDVFFPNDGNSGNPASGELSDPQGFGSDSVLRVNLGGSSNPDSATNMNGAWTRSFTLTQTTVLTISFAYLLQLAEEVEAGENAQLLMSVGGTTYTVAQLAGSDNDNSDRTISGNHEVEITLGPGTHTLALGGNLSSKTADDEFARAYFDNVKVTGKGVFTDGGFDYTLTDGDLDDPTHVTIVGQSGSTLTGTDADEVLIAGSGNDVLNANGGNDKLYGNAGDDQLNGGEGNDILVGGAGIDTLAGGNGSDTIVVQSQLGSGSFTDSGRVQVGGNGNDTGQDRINGFSFTNDTLKIVSTNVSNFTHGADTTIGSEGNSNNGNSANSYTNETGIINLADGDFDSAGNVIVTFDTALNETNFENRLQYDLSGTSGDNEITSGALADILRGLGGDDTLNGGAGNDVLIGGSGDDRLTGGLGADTFVIDDMDDIITDFGSGDVIDLTSLFEVSDGGALSDYVKFENGFLQVDTDGAGGTEDFQNAVQFQNAPSTATIAILFNNNGDDDSGSVPTA